MSKYKAKAELTKESILGKVSEIDIFSYYIKNFVDLNRRFCSELREDHTPDCCITYKYNKLFYKDFVTNDVFGCFSYVMKKFGVNYHTALKIISNDFNLNLCDPIGKPTQEKYGTKSAIKVKESSSVVIKVKYRSFNTLDQDYWYGNYFITKDLLDLYHIYPISHYWINDYCFKTEKLAYGYYQNERWKIYQPYSTDAKWFSNFNNTIYSGFDQLDWIGTNIVISSSLKDSVSWRVLGINAFSGQSEAQIPSEAIMENIKKRFKNIYVVLDNDETGIKCNLKIKEKYPYVINKHIEIEKNISDCLLTYRLESSKEVVKSIINDK